jgi:hypothetical protein
MGDKRGRTEMLPNYITRTGGKSYEFYTKKSGFDSYSSWQPEYFPNDYDMHRWIHSIGRQVLLIEDTQYVTKVLVSTKGFLEYCGLEIGSKLS